MRIDDMTSDMLPKDAVGRYPAAGVVLSRYGLDSYEETDPSSESLARFAESGGILAERLSAPRLRRTHESADTNWSVSTRT